MHPPLEDNNKSEIDDNTNKEGSKIEARFKDHFSQRSFDEFKESQFWRGTITDIIRNHLTIELNPDLCLSTKSISAQFARELDEISRIGSVEDFEQFFREEIRQATERLRGYRKRAEDTDHAGV